MRCDSTLYTYRALGREVDILPVGALQESCASKKAVDAWRRKQLQCTEDGRKRAREDGASMGTWPPWSKVESAKESRSERDGEHDVAKVSPAFFVVGTQSCTLV